MLSYMLRACQYSEIRVRTYKNRTGETVPSGFFERLDVLTGTGAPAYKRNERKTMPKALTHRILCAMATAEHRGLARQSAAEWSARIKCRLTAQGFAYPTPHAITAAMQAVAHVARKTEGP